MIGLAEAVGLGTAGLGAYGAWKQSEGATLDERAGKTTAMAMGAGLVGYAGTQLATGLVRNRPLRNAILSAPGRYIQGIRRDAGIYAGLYRSGNFGRFEAFNRFISRRPAWFLGAGAGLGAMIGEHFDSPGQGAVLGAGAGLAAQQILRFSVGAGDRVARAIPTLHRLVGRSRTATQFFKGIRNTVAATALTAGITALGLYMRPEPYESQMEAVPDGMGGYTVGESGAGRRAAMLGATGDLVLGLHNRRHG